MTVLCHAIRQSYFQTCLSLCYIIYFGGSGGGGGGGGHALLTE
jgi:hypothetical protein